MAGSPTLKPEQHLEFRTVIVYNSNADPVNHLNLLNLHRIRKHFDYHGVN